MSKQAVAIHMGGVEVDTVRGPGGQPLPLYLRNQADHLFDIRGGVGIDGRAPYAQAVHPPVPGAFVLSHDRLGGAALLVGPGDDLVVDVGDVDDVTDLVAQPFQVSAQDVV